MSVRALAGRGDRFKGWLGGVLLGASLLGAAAAQADPSTPEAARTDAPATRGGGRRVVRQRTAAASSESDVANPAAGSTGDSSAVNAVVAASGGPLAAGAPAAMSGDPGAASATSASSAEPDGAGAAAASSGKLDAASADAATSGKPRTEGISLDEPAPEGDLTWRWRRAHPLEYVAAGLAGAGAFAAFYLLESQPTPRWTSGILFDDALRDAIRVRSPGARDSVRVLSDVMGLTTLGIALVVDSLVLPLTRGARFATIAEVLLMDVEAIALTSLATTITFDEVGRARPSYDDCRRDPNFDPLCFTGVTTGFFSGHSSQAFMGAGLSCAHHQYLKLYGDATLDAISCAGSLTFATATGTLRLMGDRHYATDVIVGALVGFGFGYGVPVLLHYSLPSSDATVHVRPAGAGTGLEVYGRF